MVSDRVLNIMKAELEGNRHTGIYFGDIPVNTKPHTKWLTFLAGDVVATACALCWALRTPLSDPDLFAPTAEEQKQAFLEDLKSWGKGKAQVQTSIPDANKLLEEELMQKLEQGSQSCDIVQSQASEVSPHIGLLSGIRSLEIVNCPNLKTLPGEIGKLQNLRKITLNNVSHKAAQLPPEIRGCIQLNQLVREIDFLHL